MTAILTSLTPPKNNTLDFVRSNPHWPMPQALVPSVWSLAVGTATSFALV